MHINIKNVHMYKGKNNLEKSLYWQSTRFVLYIHITATTDL